MESKELKRTNQFKNNGVGDIIFLCCNKCNFEIMKHWEMAKNLKHCPICEKVESKNET